MKSRAIVAIASVLALTACGSKDGGGTAAPSGAASTPAAEASTAAATPAAGGAPTKEFMVGKWAEEGDCKDMAIDFKADGSMVGPVDRWELDGNKLTFVGMPDKMVLTVIDPDTMESRLNGTEKPRKLVRCK